jgi:protein-tyrosine phosphatase
MIRVLFVCMGNICRSPMAEAVFQHMVDEAGLTAQFKLDSAGTGDWHVGELAHPKTRAVLQKHKIPYDGRARQFIPQDWMNFDYIVAMDSNNLAGITAYSPKSAKIVADGQYLIQDKPMEAKLFLSYANADKTTSLPEVPDPYYNGKYDETYDLVNIGAKALLRYIRKKHGI